ncbi:MAG: alpha/beta fold hydrolase [Spirochaetaceae bacterium]|nr:alpha/beta fold hydrolase [Spirochaetaceae bacterium]
MSGTGAAGGDPLLGGRFRLGRLDLVEGGRLGWSVRGASRGGGGAVPLVLVPGSFDDRAVFAPLIGHLGDDVAVCVVELPGHGRSWPPAADGSIERFAEQVVGALDVLYDRPVCVGGHSIGGMVAIQVAGSAPARIAGVISLEGWTSHRAARAAFGGDMTGTLSARQEADRLARRARVTGRWSPDQVTGFSRIWRRWDGGPILAATRLPVLEIYGDRGRAAPTREALGIPARGNIDLQMIEGVSHYLHVERPDAVAQACRRFLAGAAHAEGGAGTAATA